MRIQTLVQDIYKIVNQNEGWFKDGVAQEFSHELGLKLQDQFNKGPDIPTLRLSKMGKRCPCALWHSIHSPLLAEPLPAYAKIKFTYGHILEALVIAMAKAAGHEVTGEQDEVTVDGVKGHRDCVIDGAIVDVKSCSSRMFARFKDGSIELDDPFGYLDQLDGYLVGSATDDLVRVKDKAYILAIDKTLGHITLHEHTIREESIRERIRDFRAIVARDRPPECTCETIPDGRSGNIRLGATASYNAFKFACRPHLRTFLYASGPVYLTKVVRKPDVIEVDRNGRIVYNG